MLIFISYVLVSLLWDTGLYTRLSPRSLHPTPYSGSLHLYSALSKFHCQRAPSVVTEEGNTLTRKVLLATFPTPNSNNTYFNKVFWG